jgi:SNF family Na+-dependent transporter
LDQASEYLYVSVVGTYDADTCTAYSDGDKSVFSVRAMFASLFVWLCIFGATYNGVKSASWVVWFTVPIPCLFILVMLFHGLTLEGSGSGIKDYLSGRQEVRDEIGVGKMWADAVSQIFFSIGVCMGSLTSYGSYNPIKKPIIADTFIISISNSIVSFVSGFAVWGIVGYMQTTMGQDPATTGTGLVFVTYP